MHKSRLRQRPNGVCRACFGTLEILKNKNPAWSTALLDAFAQHGISRRSDWKYSSRVGDAACGSQ